jgi:hypothetical protein
MKRFAYLLMLVAIALAGFYAGSAFADPIKAQCTGTVRYSGACYPGLAQDGITSVDCLMSGCTLPSCVTTDSGTCPTVTWTCYGGAYEQGSDCDELDYLETLCSSDIRSCDRVP